MCGIRIRLSGSGNHALFQPWECRNGGVGILEQGFLVHTGTYFCWIYAVCSYYFFHSDFALTSSKFFITMGRILEWFKKITPSPSLQSTSGQTWSVSESVHLFGHSLERELPRPSAVWTRGSNWTDNAKQLPLARPSNLALSRHTCYAVTGRCPPKLASPRHHPQPPHVLPSATHSSILAWRIPWTI